MKCFKELKAFKIFKDGYVQNIELSIINEKSSYRFVKAMVRITIHASRPRLQHLDFACEGNS